MVETQPLGDLVRALLQRLLLATDSCRSRQGAHHPLSDLPRAVQHEMFEYGHPRTATRKLERTYEPGSRDDLRTLACDVNAIKTDGAFEAVHETRDAIEDGGLARTVGADKTRDRAGFDGEGGAIEGADAAEARPDVAHLKQSRCRWHRSTSL